MKLKYSVGHLSGFNIDSSVKTVLDTDNPIEAIKTWITENKKDPTMVAIYASHKADVEELYRMANQNLDSVMKFAADNGYSSPFMSYMRTEIEKAANKEIDDFHEYKDEYTGEYYPDQVPYIFNLG